MDHQKTPLYDALRQFAKTTAYSFHVPGHKNGSLFNLPELSQIARLDATELSFLDQLHDPDGVILEAEEYVRDWYGSKASFFSVGGSTAGNQALVLSAVKRGDKVLVPRNCHQSVLHGCWLAGAVPVTLPAEWDQRTRLAVGVSIQIICDAIERVPDAKAIVLTYPSYDGFTFAIQDIITLAKERGLIVIVDEAHGAHFSVDPDTFPPSALALGADGVVHSAHKTLPALTMAGFVHLGRESVLDESRVRRALGIVQTSSPSYLVMASLDVARSYVATFTQADRDALRSTLMEFRKIVADAGPWEVVEEGDLLKLVLYLPGHGFTLQQKLHEQGLFTELASVDHVLLVLPLIKNNLSHKQELLDTLPKIKRAGEDIEYEQNKPAQQFRGKTFTELTSVFTTFEDVLWAEREWVSAQEAVERVVADSIVPYPPGIPLFFPGETVDEKRLHELLAFTKEGGHVQGAFRLNNEQIEILIAK